MKFYIVLNPAVNEGYATDRLEDAECASTGHDGSDFYSSVAAYFFDTYSEGEPLKIIEVEV